MTSQLTHGCASLIFVLAVFSQYKLGETQSNDNFDVKDSLLSKMGFGGYGSPEKMVGWWWWCGRRKC